MDPQPNPPTPQPVPPTPPPAPATQKQKIILFGFLLISSILIFLWWFSILSQFEAQLRIEHKIQWAAPTNNTLKSGPPEFMYDRGNNLLCYKGVIDAQTKSELVSLLIMEDTNNSAKFAQTYYDAIDNLAYVANDSGGRIIFLLLMIGGLSAMLGVQLRSVMNYVNVICYKKDFDALLWWPWYIMRPLAGFLIGVTVVLLVKAEVLFKGEAAVDGSLWWAGVALLAGFGASEFTDRLRLLSRTMFGEGETEPKTNNQTSDKF
jgi:hypothetical protein